MDQTRRAVSERITTEDRGERTEERGERTEERGQRTEDVRGGAGADTLRSANSSCMVSLGAPERLMIPSDCVMCDVMCVCEYG
jgi:hypothetical protein